MEQRNRKISAFSRVRRGFYKQIEEKDKKEKRKIVALALSCLLLASTLLFTATLIETSGKGKYVYVFGNYEQSINTDLCFSDGVQLIDMNALASYCGFAKEERNRTVTFKINNTYATFENGSNIVNVNGIKTEMPAVAQIKNGYCLIPLDTVNDIIFGIEINADKKEASILKAKETMYIFDKNPKIEYPDSVSAYLEYVNSKDEYIYTLLNKQNPISEEFEPENLVVIPTEYSRKDKNIYLQETALKALLAMVNDMAENGVDDIYVQSAYRSHSYQEMLFNMYVESEMEKGLSKEQAIINANKYSAKPEFSEHRTGLCIDFTTNSIGGAVDDVFETTAAFAWLKENSWKYGFIMRYPEDKEEITGYIYESWHYRFVGLEVASVMYQTGLCYEEYLQAFGVNNSLQ